MTELQIQPSDVESEEAILGEMFRSTESLEEIMDSMEPGDFYATKNQLIFQTAQRLHFCGDPVDLTTVFGDLSDNGNIEKSGGASYLSYLLDKTFLLDIRYTIQRLKQKSALRRAIELCNAGMKRCFDQSNDPVETIEYIQKSISAIDPSGGNDGNAELIGHLLDKQIEYWKEIQGREGYITGVPTGLRHFDFLTCGFQPADLIIVAARPSMGKTALALRIARHAAGLQLPVAIFSLEQPKSQLIDRLTAAEASIDGQKFRSGMFSEEDMKKIIFVKDPLKRLPIIIDDEGGLTYNEIRRRARKLKRSHGIKLIIIDHLQLVGGTAKRQSNRNEDLGAMTRAFKEMSKELNIPSVVLSQLNRNLENRDDKRPRMSDLRESGNIEQDADVISFLYRPEVYSDKEHESPFEGYTEFGICKQRNGPLGVAKLKFLKRFAQFENLSDREVPFGSD